jgi:hypothetical protein
MPIFDRVQRGERLTIRADQWNALAALAERAADGRFGAANQLPEAYAPNIALVRNDHNIRVPRFGVLVITGVVINPATSAALAAEFAARPILRGTAPSLDNDERIVVMLEPVEPGAVGRAAVSGVFACRVNVCDPAHRYAGGKFQDATQLQSAAAGPVLMLWRQGEGADQWAVGAM